MYKIAPSFRRTFQNSRSINFRVFSNLEHSESRLSLQLQWSRRITLRRVTNYVNLVKSKNVTDKSCDLYFSDDKNSLGVIP